MIGQRDTIAAISTAPGRSGVAVIRVSGGEAFEVARRLSGKYPQSGRISFMRLPVDEAVVLAFRGPNSYTGEDTVEFQCHGGAVSPRRVLSAVLSAGARLARRGEFTERAFLNGRITYEQAEGVIDLIDAKTDRAADDALAGLGGERSRRLRAVYSEAVDLSAAIEHSLDVDEGELPGGFADSMAKRADALRGMIADEIRRMREGHILRSGALVVLAGPPNAGKSSLMNALLGTCRAIVSDTPGTTRDSIEEWLDLDGWPVRLVDTAGLRRAVDAIESEGVARANELIAKADIVVALDCEVAAKRVIAIHAKCDLGAGSDLNVSARTGEGLDELKSRIIGLLPECGGDAPSNRVTATLTEAHRDLATADGRDLVLLANGVRLAAERIGRLLGATYSEDLLDNLFSRFCVGK